MNIANLGPAPFQTILTNQATLMGDNWARWINQLYTGLTPTYSCAFFEAGSQWTYDAPTFGDPVPSGAYDLTTLKSNVIVLSPAASNKLGIAFNPSYVGSLYFISAQLQIQSSANWVAGRIWDGTTVIGYGNGLFMNLGGFYSPGTTDEVEITVQLADNTSGIVVSDPSGLTSSAILTVTQLK